MSVSFKVENVSISAVRDRAMFNTFAGNQSYIVKGIGDELKVTSSTNSFTVTLGTGEAIICGGSTLSEGEANTLTLGQNESGYIVIEVDLSQTGVNICRFARVTELTQQNINGGSEYIYDLPLYQYTTSSEGVQNIVDIRDIREGAYTVEYKSLSIPTSSVVANSTYSDYSYKFTTSWSGMTSTDYADCPDEISGYTGAYALETSNGALNIYFSSKPSSNLSIEVTNWKRRSV